MIALVFQRNRSQFSKKDSYSDNSMTSRQMNLKKINGVRPTNEGEVKEKLDSIRGRIRQFCGSN